MKSFHGAHAIVTGGSSGIGRATAERLAASGASVSLIARGRERLEEAAAALRNAGARVATAAVDVADQAATAAAVESLTTEMGPCDVLVASAGFARPGYFADLDDAVFRRQMEVNYFGTLHAIRVVVPSMVERRRGSIVGVSSAAGFVGVFGYTAYAPTKFAVRGLLESLRAELAPRGVHVGCVFPPNTLTPGLEYENLHKPRETHAVEGTIKALPPERVAEAIARGIRHEEFWIIADAQTKLLARFGGLVRGALSSAMDRKVRRAR